MTLPQAIALAVAALLGGALNSVAGGGSFITLPTLVFTGVPPVQSSATSTVALWPGSITSAVAYRKSLVTRRATLIVLGAASVVGGVLGAEVLLHTAQKAFLGLIPYLLLLATLLFAFGGQVTTWMRGRARADKGRLPGWLALGLLVPPQLLIAAYGGFFGGGIGMLMLALLSIAGMRDIHAMNALKNILASCINGVAVITFVVAGAVFWAQALVMVVGAVAGGYFGVVVARRINPTLVRYFVILVGLGMSAYFFVYH
ncbi:MAG TPA: sulfite exporter TauE/SafE family protein [Ktedonobacterales bacterium]|jgi:hypothetical protein